MGDQSALGDGIPTYHDSQITSQNALPPIYSSGITFQQALHLWKEADDANKTLPEKESFLLHLKEELDNQRPLAEELKTKSSKLFRSLKAGNRTSMRGLFRKNSADKTGDNAPSSAYRSAHEAESKQQELVAQLTQKLSDTESEVTRLKDISAQTEDRFARLRGAAYASIPPSDFISPALAAADEEADAAALAYHSAENTLKDLLRARVTLQHAHHYHGLVLKTNDSIRGTPLGRAFVGGFNEVSKNRDYQAGVNTAIKAETCLREGVKMLRQQLAIIPEDIQVEVEALSKLGLLQMGRMYELMYRGPRGGESDSGQKVAVLIERMESAYAMLTKIAVWVQNKVPEIEEQVRVAKDKLLHAREALISLWVEVNQPRD